VFPRRVQPIWYLEFRGAKSLAKLGFLETLARSIVSGVVPLVALESLGSNAAVSWAYVGGASMGLVVTLHVGRMERALARRWVTTIGLGSLVGAAFLFMFVTGPVITVGIGLLATAASLFSITLSLFIMESVSKQDLTRSEGYRLIYSGAAWFIGPASGVWLYQTVSPTAPFLISATLATASLIYFWALRIGDNPALSEPTTTATSPIETVPRFFRQRYLRIAYAITLVRAMFWVSIFIYGTLYIIATDLAAWTSGVFLSSVATLLFFSPLIARLAERFGTRSTVVVSFLLISVGMLLVAGLGDPRPLGLVGWSIAAVGASVIDVVSNIPFMRLVKKRDRVAMTSVFATWRDLSALAAPAIAALVLVVAPLSVFYLCLAVLAAGAAVATSYLPRRI